MLLLDNSAWSRVVAGTLPSAAADAVAGRLEGRELATCLLAVRAQAELATRGHHRLAPIDLMIAACAHEAGAGVLHYDRDYDVIAEPTSLQFESVWVAPAGSL